MPKRQEVERRQAILFRLTAEEAEVLETVAFLHHITGNEFARREIVASLKTWAEDPSVCSLIDERSRFDAKPRAAIGHLVSVSQPDAPVKKRLTGAERAIGEHQDGAER